MKEPVDPRIKRIWMGETLIYSSEKCYTFWFKSVKVLGLGMSADIHMIVYAENASIAKRVAVQKVSGFDLEPEVLVTEDGKPLDFAAIPDEPTDE